MKDILGGVRQYILVDGAPVREPDLLKWAEWYEKADNRIVKQTVLDDRPQVMISTVFLAIDHSWGEGVAPTLWETMVFGLPGNEEYQWRYKSEAKAKEHHDVVVQAIKDGKNLNEV